MTPEIFTTSLRMKKTLVEKESKNYVPSANMPSVVVSSYVGIKIYLYLIHLLLNQA